MFRHVTEVVFVTRAPQIAFLVGQIEYCVSDCVYHFTCMEAIFHCSFSHRHVRLFFLSGNVAGTD